MKKYHDFLKLPNLRGIKEAHIGGICAGYSQCQRFIFTGIVFYLTAFIIYKDPSQNVEDVWTGSYILFMAAFGCGMHISNAPDVEKAKDSASKIFEIIDEKSKIDVRDTTGIEKIKEGKIEFKGVNFSYPSRP